MRPKRIGSEVLPYTHLLGRVSPSVLSPFHLPAAMLILLWEFFLGSPRMAAFLGGKRAGMISLRMARFSSP